MSHTVVGRALVKGSQRPNLLENIGYPCGATGGEAMPRETPPSFSLSVHARRCAKNEVYPRFLTTLFAAKPTLNEEGNSTSQRLRRSTPSEAPPSDILL